jgi:hypothetical protein
MHDRDSPKEIVDVLFLKNYASRCPEYSAVFLRNATMEEKR